MCQHPPSGSVPSLHDDVGVHPVSVLDAICRRFYGVGRSPEMLCEQVFRHPVGALAIENRVVNIGYRHLVTRNVFIVTHDMPRSLLSLSWTARERTRKKLWKRPRADSWQGWTRAKKARSAFKAPKDSMWFRSAIGAGPVVARLPLVRCAAPPPTLRHAGDERAPRREEVRQRSGPVAATRNREGKGSGFEWVTIMLLRP
jgi:hypothetical protein